MNNFTRTIYGMLTVIFTLSFNNSNAQCGVSSSNGYVVDIEVRPVSLIAPSSCPWGYNYNVNITYNVAIVGNNVPASLYTLQGFLYCGNQGNFFQLPLTGGSGAKATSSNPWRSTPDCASATTTSLQCNSLKITISGPGIPNQVINCATATGVILPINLVSFNGRLVNNNNVYLAWETASETNNQAFTVERSTDAVKWEAIKSMNGAMNSSSIKHYDHTDEGLSIGTYYYRLKQTDVSGASSYSNIIGANITKGNGGKDISLYYNLSNQLQFTGLGNSSEWEIAVFNTSSAVVMTTNKVSSSTVQLPNLTPGIYFVKLRNKLTNAEKTLKFFKG